MNKTITFLILLLLFSNLVWGFGDFKERYYQALKGDGKASNALCGWFQIYTDGQIFDDDGKQLDTSVSKIDQFCLNAAEKGFPSAQVIVGSKYAGMQSEAHKAEAIKWLTKAAHQGEKDAYSWLGEMYAAQRGFDSWKKTTATERYTLLNKWHDLMIQHQKELANIMVIEQGKPLAEAMGEAL